MFNEEEYHRRIRRCMGIFDDTTKVTVSEETGSPYNTGCDTCGYGADDPYTIEVWVSKPGKRWVDAQRKTWSSMDSFLNDLFAVTDE